MHWSDVVLQAKVKDKYPEDYDLHEKCVSNLKMGEHLMIPGPVQPPH